VVTGAIWPYGEKKKTGKRGEAEHGNNFFGIKGCCEKKDFGYRGNFAGRQEKERRK